MTVTDDYLANNVDYASGFKGPLPMPPSKHIAIVACMDARLDVYRMLGIKEGEAHVIRNAGCVVTDDVIRSLAISQRLLGTREIILLHHTDCGMLTFTDDDFKRASRTRPASDPRGRPSRTPTPSRTSVSRCAASRSTRSSPSTRRCAASSSMSPPANSTRSRPSSPSRQPRAHWRTGSPPRWGCVDSDREAWLHRWQ